MAYEKLQLCINSRGALHGYIKIRYVKLFYTSQSAAQPPAFNDKQGENVIMICGWFCQSLDKLMSVLVLCRQVSIYEIL